MNLTEISIKNPYIVITFGLLVAVLGLISFFRTPVDLFPDTAPPQVLVLTIEPGASAKDVSDKITQIIEKEVNTISEIKRVRSVSRDEVSAVTAEFLYSKDINEAVTDVMNALGRIRAELPQDIMPIQVYKITDATRAAMTLALSPKKGSKKTLQDIRLLAENYIKDELLRLPEVGDVDVFGGYIPEVKIEVDRDKLKAYGLSLMDVVAQISRRNITIPGGYLYTKKNEFLIRTSSEFKNLDEIKNLPIKKKKDGYVLLKDVAEVKQGIAEMRSLYHGNGHPAIAMNILRPENGHTRRTIRDVKKFLPMLKREYPDINFEITNDQEPIIDINLKGMRSSLIQAIWLTVLIIFIFLANKRTAAVISISIPMSFLFSLMVLKFSPYTMNMVTLSGLIIAVGMVVDASIVVLENIYRHFQEDKSLSGKDAAMVGANEVALANTAGALTTIVVLIPVMFVGGYPQKILRQLSIMIASTIFASLIVSLTIVPLMASHLLNRSEQRQDPIERLVSHMNALIKKVSDFYISVLKVALRYRKITFMITMATFVLTIRIVVPLLVGELMPPMDTGIVKVTLDMPSNYNVHQVESVLNQVEDVIKKTPGFLTMSSVVGSEPGQISFGGGGATAQTVSMTVNLVTRDKRKKTIWQIEDEWRRKLRQIDGLRSFMVMDYGATPISTTKAPFDLILSGEDTRVLDKMASSVLVRLKGTKGLVDVRRSWYIDKPELKVVPDARLCRLYGVDEETVAKYIKLAAKGFPVSFMRLEGFLDIPIRVEYRDKDINDPAYLDNVYVPTRYGPVPLRAMAKVTRDYIQPFITREDLQNTIDITALNRVYTIAQAAHAAGMRLKKTGGVLPRGYSVRMSGTPEDMLDSKRRLRKALLFGLILLYMVLLPMYKSFSHPIVIMVAIPLAAIGAMWGLLIFDKPMCMPALMGIILLAGTIVNNSILLLDFILNARARGLSREEAIIQSVRVRTRPILMTASSTVIGLTPLVFEMAVGLERLSPLGIVAAAGLILGTFLTMIVIPVIYTLIDDLKVKLFPGKGESRAVAAVFLLFFLMFGNNNLYAGDGSGSRRFSLKSAIDYALMHSPDIKAAEAKKEKAIAGKVGAMAGLLPQVSISGSYTHYDEPHAIVPGMIGTKQRFDDDVFAGRLQAEMLITDFGRSFYSYKAAKERYLASLDGLYRRKEAVAYMVGNLYANIVAIDELLDALSASLESIKELERRMELFLRQGKIANLDLLKVKVRLSEIKSQISQTKARRKYLIGMLKEAMGYKGDLKLDEEMGLLSIDEDKISFDAVVKKAMDNRRDLAVSKEILKAAKFSVVSAKRSYFPTLQVFAGAGEFGGRDSKARFSDGDRWEDDTWVGLKGSYSFFDGGRKKAAVLSALANYDEAMAEENKLELSIYKEVGKAIADVFSAKERLSLAMASKKEAEEALRLEKLKYEKGKGTINNILDAEAALRKAEGLYASAKADYNTSVFELYFAEGILLDSYTRIFEKEVMDGRDN